MNLRTRLTLLAIVTTFLSVLLLTSIADQNLNKDLIDELDTALELQALVIGETILQDVSIPGLGRYIASRDGVAQIIQDDTVVWHSEDVALAEPLDLSFLALTEDSAFCTCDGKRVFSQRTADGIVQVARSLEPINTFRETLRRRLSMAGAAIILWLGAVSFLGMALFTYPLKRLSEWAQTFNLQTPVPHTKSKTEVGTLARALQSSVRELERSREREKAFIATASHDLKTPVMALKLSLDLARKQASNDSSVGLERAYSEAVKLTELSTNLLALHRSDYKENFVELDLFSVVADAVDALMPLASSKNLEMSFEGKSFVMLGDSVLLTRLINNLISNAIKFTEKGEIEITLAVNADDASLSVKDTGQGFPDSLDKELLEPFKRAHGATKHDGVGLGLAVVRAVAQAHGGSVILKNHAKGGCVTVDLHRVQKSGV